MTELYVLLHFYQCLHKTLCLNVAPSLESFITSSDVQSHLLRKTMLF